MIDIVFLFLINKCKNCVFVNQIIFLISLTPHFIIWHFIAPLCLCGIFPFTDVVSSLIQQF